MKKVFYVFLSSLLMVACATTEKPKESMNPLLTEFETPFGVPPFEQIQNEHYLPAYQAAIEAHKTEIATIISNTEDPDFDNTILAFDRAGKMMSRISPVFGGLRSANTNPQLQELAREITPMLTAHSNEVRFNQDLFARIKTVYDNREELDLDREQMRLTEKIYNDFARNGAALPEAERDELKALNQQTSMVSLQLGENLLAENNNFKLVLEDEADLAGLPEDVISSAAAEAIQEGLEGKWVFTLAKPSWIPFLQFSEKRELREKLYRGYFMRGDNDNEHDNKALFLELMQLRRKSANMLGYDNYAQYFIAEQMAQTPENVYDFLYQIWEPALKAAKSERDAQQELINRDGGEFNFVEANLGLIRNHQHLNHRLLPWRKFKA